MGHAPLGGDKGDHGRMWHVEPMWSRADRRTIQEKPKAQQAKKEYRGHSPINQVPSHTESRD
ncbi:uncharacterized protein G2W53_044730 [Senna tora]|uniref:Uncharacterized protein n=1 Tax=Senna tora TaxID=362788 RepID=A0A834SCS2_9FABA|nr:uncharacterized protein G2W53_044730 [Senna tora]